MSKFIWCVLLLVAVSCRCATQLAFFLYLQFDSALPLNAHAACFGGTNIDPTAWEDKKCPGESRFPAQGKANALLCFGNGSSQQVYGREKTHKQATPACAVFPFWQLEEGGRAEHLQAQKCRVRLDHVESADPENLSEWNNTRLKRILVDYMLRMSYYDTAEKLAECSNLQDLVDIDVFQEAKKVIDALQNKDVAPALSWCADNKSRLKKSKSKLEFQLRLQEFIELVRAENNLRAITYARKYLAPWGATHMKELQRVIATLAFKRDTECATYKVLFEAKQWDYLVDQFKQEFCKLYGMTLEPLLNIYLQAGLSALKTPYCYEDDCTKEDPLSQEAFRKLALPLPYSKQHHSKLVCYITKKLMDTENPPQVLPNGYVYSTKALEEMAKKNNGRIICPRTGKTTTSDDEKEEKEQGLDAELKKKLRELADVVRSFKEKRQPERKSLDAAFTKQPARNSLYAVFTNQPASVVSTREEVKQKEPMVVKELSADMMVFVKYLFENGYFKDANFAKGKERFDPAWFERFFARGYIKFAAQKFARDNQEIAKWLSGSALKQVAEFGCPSTDRSNVFTAKRLRKFFEVPENTVCSKCTLRQSCKYENQSVWKCDTNKLDLVIVMKVITSYALELVHPQLVVSDQVNKSVSQLLKEVVKLSQTT
ncbi:Zinc finger, RING/FYVE/PHD-type [Sesbania bispinosa]|nr:Zinc finger, RING/FYVE/PHD-type [Sesbania bispinosa]